MYANYMILDKSLYLIMGLLNIPLLFIIAPGLLLIVITFTRRRTGIGNWERR